MVTHSSILAWRFPWTQEPGGATVHRVIQSQTQLKRLSTHKKKHMKQEEKNHFQSTHLTLTTVFESGYFYPRSGRRTWMPREGRRFDYSHCR